MVMIELIIRFTTTYAISSNPAQVTLCDKVCECHLQQVNDYLWVLLLSPPIKLTAMI